MTASRYERVLFDLHSAVEKAQTVTEEVEAKYTHHSMGMPDGTPVRKNLMNRHRISDFVRIVQQKVKTDSQIQFFLAGIVLEGVKYATLSGTQADFTAMDVVKRAYDHIIQGNVSYANRYFEDFLQTVTPEKIGEYLKRRPL